MSIWSPVSRFSLPKGAAMAAFMLILLSGLAACIAERDQAIVQDPEYKAGYSDGCRTANTRVAGVKSTIHRNKALYETSENYRAGWGDGYSNCAGPTQQQDRDIFSDEFSQPGYDPMR